MKTCIPPKLKNDELVAVKFDGEWHEFKIKNIFIGHDPAPNMWTLRPYVGVEFYENALVRFINYSLYCEQGWIVRLHY